MKPSARRPQTILLLDASALETQTGLMQNGQWLSFQRAPGETLETLFLGVSRCLREARLEFDRVDGFLYCEGPGSVLGIRLAAMALQGWKSLPGHKSAPITAYRSLPTIARLIQLKERLKLPFHCISEGGQGLWNLFSLKEGNSTHRLAMASQEVIENLKEPVFHIPLGRQKQPPLNNATPHPYNIEGIPSLMNHEDIFHSVDDPVVYRSQTQDYVKWSAQRHR